MSPEGPRKGRMIVIEGADGAGKSTQAHVLVQRLTAAGYDVEFIKFPQYDQPSSHFIRAYLNGEYGPAGDIGPYTGSLFYALDRYEAAPRIQKALNDGKIVVADRYVASNMAHQGSKISDSIEQRSFFIWEDSLEFQLLGIPRPDLNIFLRLPPEISYQQAGKTRRRTYTSDNRDEHEKDIAHLEATSRAYDILCELFPRDFKAVDAVENGQLLSITELSNRIWSVTKPLLPAPSRKGHSVVLDLKTPPPQAPKMIKGSLTESKSKHSTNVNNSKSVSLLGLTQLMSMSPKRLDFDSLWLSEKALSDKLRWITPAGLGDKTEEFNSTIKQIAKNRSTIADKVGLAAASSLIPLAAKFRVELTADDLRLEMSLNELAEIRRLTTDASSSSSKKEVEVEKIKQLISKRLVNKPTIDSEIMSLVEITPRNEMDLLAPLMYPDSNLSQRALAAELDNWTYEQKAEALELAIHQVGGRVQKAVKYRFDCLDDWATLIELYRYGLIKSLRLQEATIQFGIETPPSVEAAGLEEIFQEAVTASENLYKLLSDSHSTELAGYACLSGHKLRFQFITDASALYKASKAVSKGSAGTIVKLAIEKISEAQPIIGRWLAYVESDAALTPKSSRPAKKKLPKSRHRS